MARDKLKCVCGILVDTAKQKFCEDCGADLKMVGDSYRDLEQDPEYLELKKRLEEKERNFQRATEAKIKEKREDLDRAKKISELDTQISHKKRLTSEKLAMIDQLNKEIEELARDLKSLRIARDDFNKDSNDEQNAADEFLMNSKFRDDYFRRQQEEFEQTFGRRPES